MRTRFFVPSGILCLLVGPAALFAQRNSPLVDGKTQRGATPSGLVTKSDLPKPKVLPPTLTGTQPVVVQSNDWKVRDLSKLIISLSRKGPVSMVPFPVIEDTLVDYIRDPSGKTAYGFLVPAGGRLWVSMDHPKPARSRLVVLDSWGRYVPGMKAQAGENGVGFTNTGADAKAVFVVADDPERWSSEASPYTLKASRSWDPKAEPLPVEAKGVFVAWPSNMASPLAKK